MEDTLVTWSFPGESENETEGYLFLNYGLKIGLIWLSLKSFNYFSNQDSKLHTENTIFNLALTELYDNQEIIRKTMANYSN